ncbi:TetR/AcrR family transcriptional regulator [Mycobacterium nebraskense]|uniref:TetR/AcrR family transcriptional regulator n=1 Tax=Mycobacterium nebraskense TaxID=244292 RepID=UPI0023F0C786|nr:TetR/AcrR family transcriptional regulator [Mycobacterium nebraskense]MBI2695739.1 TetR/AcrR family transcriptional regulator [Mycobacterium nebraskense]
MTTPELLDHPVLTGTTSGIATPNPRHASADIRASGDSGQCENGCVPGKTKVNGQAVTRGEGRRLLLESARALFAERGYAGTSTREIARAASVSEPMIFRHFGSKAKLFEEAVLAPFNTFVSEYVADWAARPRGMKSAYVETYDFYRGVYDVLSANRRLIHEMIGARAVGGPLSADTASAPQMGRLLERFEAIMRDEITERGFRSFDPTVVTRVVFGMVFSIAVFGDWLFEGSTHPQPSAEEYIGEMARLTIYGAYPEGTKPPAAP